MIQPPASEAAPTSTLTRYATCSQETWTFFAFTRCLTRASAFESTPFILRASVRKLRDVGYQDAINSYANS